MAGSLLAQGKPIGKPTEVGESTAWLTILPDNSTWVACDGQATHGEVRLGKVGAKRDTVSWQVQQSEITAAAGSPDGRLLATGDKAGAITLWEWNAIFPPQ